MKPIFITGCARSGTSMVAGIIARCGAWGGNICGATVYNPRGQYENTEIRNGVIKPLLKKLKADPMGQDPLPRIWDVEKAAEHEYIQLRRQVDQIMKNQGYVNHVPWYFKGAKICLIWPIWMRAYPDAYYIIVHRPDKLTVKSCMRTSFMRKRNSMYAWQEWINTHKSRFKEMQAFRPDNVFMISSLDIVNGDYYEIRQCVESIGLKWDFIAVDNFVDPKIWATAK